MGKIWSAITLFVKRWGPTAMVVGGGLGTVASTVYACKQTIKFDEMMQKAENDQETIKLILEGKLKLPDNKPYSQADYEHDKKMLDKLVIQESIKIFAGPAIAQLASLALMGIGFAIEKHNGTIMAGVAATATGAFAKYRMAHPDTDHDTFAGKETTEVVQNPETGAIEEVRKRIMPSDGTGKWYGRVIFDESNFKFTKSHYDNIMFLKTAEHDLNNRMIMNGHIFLNEILRYLGFEEIPEGQILGLVDDGTNRVNFFLDYYIKELSGDLEVGANRVARPIVLDMSWCVDILHVYKKAFGPEMAEKLVNGG